jgi:hypothetical protein
MAALSLGFVESSKSDNQSSTTVRCRAMNRLPVLRARQCTLSRDTDNSATLDAELRIQLARKGRQFVPRFAWGRASSSFKAVLWSSAVDSRPRAVHQVASDAKSS